MNNVTYGNNCPVCGYELDFVPEVDALCPCCFFAFYVNDRDWTFAELREDWISHGARWAWGKQGRPEPLNWNPVQQLTNIGYLCTTSDLESIVRAKPASSKGAATPIKPRRVKRKPSQSLTTPTPSST